MRRISLACSMFFVPLIAVAQVTSESDHDNPTVQQAIIEEMKNTVDGTATIIVEQTALDGSAGSWLLSLPDHTQRSGSGDTLTISDAPTGNFVIYSNRPTGVASTVRIFRNGTQEDFFERQQAPFIARGGDTLRISIHYRLEHTGRVAVKSDPSGTSFTLTGPDNVTYTGVTPETFESVPEGQYKLQYESFAQDCVKPAPKASQLVRNGRISFDIRFECDSATAVRKRSEKDDKKYLKIVVDGVDLQLRDVLQTDWFSPYIYESAKRSILSGYRDENGTLTGMFGPSNHVTVGELSKIAHRLAGISEEAFLQSSPRNPAGLNQWFSPFLASSEERGWTIYADARIDPMRPATRGEVVVTLMQAFDVPIRWQKGNVFKDVPASHPYAAAIETAANDKILSGRTDERGVSLGMFDPEAPISRAEIAKIITTILDTYSSPTSLRNAASRAEED